MSTRIPSFASGLAALGLLAAAAHAQPPAESPTEQHEWLQQLVGTWDSKATITIPGGGGSFETEGVSENRMMGGFWLVSEVTSDYGGQEMPALQQIGFDPKKQSFIGTWTDASASRLWTYEGRLSDDGKTLNLESEGPNFLTGKGTAEFRDSYTVESPDRLKAESFIKQDGKWVPVVEGVATRRK